MKSKKKSKSLKQKKAKEFNVQVICTCKRQCCNLIDALTQKDIFDCYKQLDSWSKKVKFLRTIAKREQLNENLNPRVHTKKKKYVSSYYINDANGLPQRVCSMFLEGLLQINRAKLYRAISTVNKNPNAIDGRGKMRKKKTNPADMLFVENFLGTLPCFESKMNATLSQTKYLHPNLSIKKVYQLYRNICEFQNRVVLSKQMFQKIWKNNFSYLKPFKSWKTVCRSCKKIKAQKKPKILSVQQLEKFQKEEKDHLAAVKEQKNKLTHHIATSEKNDTEVLTFELQRPFEIPCLTVDETYDWKQLWLFNLCVFDQLRGKAYMYVWDESIAKKGPEEIASCLLKHINTIIPKTTKKIILYSKQSSLYRNMKLSLMLKKICDYSQEFKSTIIEQRFFLSGHDSNDCNWCFEAIDKQRKTASNLFTPDDWIKIIASTKRGNTSFVVSKMTENNFFSVEKLIKLMINENCCANGQQIHWSKILNITYTPSDPWNLCVSHINKEYLVYLLSSQDVDEFRRTRLVYSSKGGNVISKTKYDNLQMNLKYIPDDHHPYYNAIKFSADLSDQDFALASYDSTGDEYSDNES